LDAELSRGLKRKLHRIVSMLTRMAMKLNGVAEAQAGYGVEGDYEHRFAEHEHPSATKPESGCRGSLPSPCPLGTGRDRFPS